VSTDGNYIGAGLSYSSHDNANARARNQLHSNTRPGIYLAQIINQLLQVFNAVNIMMRWRRYQGHTGHRTAQFGNVRANLEPGKLSSLTRLRALRHLDFDFLRVN